MTGVESRGETVDCLHCSISGKGNRENQNKSQSNFNREKIQKHKGDHFNEYLNESEQQTKQIKETCLSTAIAMTGRRPLNITFYVFLVLEQTIQCI